MVKIEKGCLCTFEQDVLTGIDCIVQKSDGVTYIWLQALRVRHKLGHDALDVKGIAAGVDNVEAFFRCTLAYLFGERFQVDACARSNTNASSLIGIRRSDALQRRTDFVVP
jgi:hypothetical protein